MSKIIVFRCRENDTDIQIHMDCDDDSEIDEIDVGCFDCPKAGWQVIGFNDLKAALYMAGYTLTKGR